MKRITNNTAAMVALFGTMLFWLLVPILGNKIMLEIASNLLLGVMLGVMVRWALPALNALKDGGRDGPNFLSLAIFGIAAASFFHRTWVNIIRWLDRPAWALESSVTAFAVWCLMISGAMIILAPGTERGVVPKGNQVWLLLSVSIGSLTTGIMIGFSLSP